MIHFEDFIKQDEADKYNMLQECNAYIKSKDKEIKRLNGALLSHEILLKSNALEIVRLGNIIKEVREYIKFLKEHYKELRISPVEDSYFINDMLRQMFIQSIENYLVGIEDILDKGSDKE